MEKETPLYAEHVTVGARVVSFAGFLMPLQYTGIIDEHNAVRQRMGMFDLSHMGEFRVTGKDAVRAVDHLVTNDVDGLQEGQIRYTAMCYPDAGIVDDLLVYRFPDHILLVVNAANIEKDLLWVQEQVQGDVQVEDVGDQTALIAVQGPEAERFLQGLADVDLAAIEYYHFTTGQIAGAEAVISRTGYTGEDGFELYVEAVDARRIWRTLCDEGKPKGLTLCGLGARDTLRLEAGYMLYGNDIDHSTSPLEAGLGWTVKFGEHDFVGRDVLERQKTEGLARRMVQVEMLDRGIPRPHFPVWHDESVVGSLTSGTFSPTFQKGIGLGYLQKDHAKVGTEIGVEIREQQHPARVAKKPMYKREGA